MITIKNKAGQTLVALNPKAKEELFENRVEILLLLAQILGVTAHVPEDRSLPGGG